MGLGRRHAVGVAFVALVVLALGLFVQYYRQALPWQDTVEVSLVTRSAGLGLDPPADVKLRGIVVGQVREVTADGGGATVHLFLDPDRRDQIPANVDAAIVPKTLFGQKFVDLILPARPSAPITEGAVIRQSTTSTELQTVFADLKPVLDTLRPDLVSRTLTAMASALDGRGAQLGTTLSELAQYLRGIVPHTDTLLHDLRRLATVSNVYADHARDIIGTLDDARGITRELLVPSRAALDGFLTQVAATADRTRGVLQRNGDDIVQLLGETVPVLRVLSQYSIALPCLVHGFKVGNNLTDHALGGSGPFLRVAVDLPSTQNRVYTAPKDLPGAPGSDANVDNLADGIPSDKPYCTQIQSRNENLPDVRALSYNYDGPGSPAATTTTPSPASTSSPAVNGIGRSGSRAEIAMVQGLTRARPGRPVDGGVATLMIGPLLRNGVVVP